VLIDNRGEIIARYSKAHPANESHVTPGRELKPFDTPIGRVGFLLCSDRHYPENFGVLGVQGVQIIFLPMDGSGGPDNTQAMRQRARDNHCWIVVANTWSCAVLSPTGEVYLEKYETECVSVQRLDLYDTPRGEQRTRFIGRRPDLYEPLTRSFEEKTLFDEHGRPTELEEKKRRDWLEELRELHKR
jgi:predicted amidohydrolase